jgi:hypothetical protein
MDTWCAGRFACTASSPCTGLPLMYGGAVLAVFLPLFGIVVNVGLFVVGVLLVAIGAGAGQTAREIDDLLSARAANRQRQ